MQIKSLMRLYSLLILFFSLYISTVSSFSNQDSIASLATQFHKEGIDFYLDQNYDVAISSFEQAIVLRKEFLPAGDEAFVKGNHNIGSCYYEMWNYEEAIKFYNRSIAINLSRTEAIKSRLAEAYKMLGRSYFKKGDIKNGSDYLKSSETIFKEIYTNSVWELAGFNVDLSLFFISQNEPISVVKYAQEALNIYTNIKEKYDDDWWGMADAYNNLGIGLELKNELEPALEAYQKALEINQRYPKKRLEYVARIYNNLSIIYKKQAAYSQALESCDAAITINERLEMPFLLARNYHNKGEVLAKQGLYKKALQYQQQALQKVIYNFTEMDYYENPFIQDAIIFDKVNVLTYLWSKAKALRGLAQTGNPQKNYVAALDTYETLLELGELIRYSLSTDDSKSFLASNIKIIMEEAIETALLLEKITQDKSYLRQAFMFAERSKAAVLLEAVSRQQAKQSLNLLASSREKNKETRQVSLIRLEQKMQRDIAQLEQVFFSAQQNEAAEKIPPLRQELLMMRSTLKGITDSLQNIGVYDQTAEKEFDLSLIQKQLLENGTTNLIEFFVGERNIYRFIVQEEDLQITKIPLDFPLQVWIEKLRKGIYEGQVTTALLTKKQKLALHQQYATYAWQLYEKLFFANGNPIHWTAKTIIIPDGILAYIPFDALLTQAVENNYADFSQYAFLARKHLITYGYSAALLNYAHRSISTTKEKQLIAFVPDYLPPSISISNADRNLLLPLKYSQQEAERVLELFPDGQLIMNAKKQDFWDLASSVSLLHFSAHAVVNAENPDYSYIAFSQTKEGLDESELLFINDLYASSLAAEMVVLSACETGLGNIDRGEGVLSLARAFTYAGAKSIITSLWRVNDLKTTTLITRFYELLEAGHDKDKALFLAKKEVIEAGIDIHPYFWAGFVPIGNMNPIVRTSYTWWYALGIVFLGILFLGIKKFK